MRFITHLNEFFSIWMIKRLKASGYSSFAARSLSKQRVDDLFKNKTTSLSKKIWAQKRGFLSETALFYGLTEANYRNYLSDFDYARLHPINGPYSKWIDDKLTLRYLLAPFSEYLPHYYYHIYGGKVLTRNPKSCPTVAGSQGEVLRLMDCPDDFPASIDGILRLLQDMKILACKPVAGSLSVGFIKLAWDGENYAINNRPAARQDLETLFSGWMQTGKVEYLVTEYVSAHLDLQKIFQEAPSVLRLIVLREKGQPARIPWAYLNFLGRGIPGSNDQNSRGNACLVDMDTGHFYGGKRLENGVIVDCPRHPVTGVLAEGMVPHWALLKQKISAISAYLPHVRWMGLDIIITVEGFKIIEINSHQGISFAQYKHPFLIDEIFRDFFLQLLEEKNIRR